MEDKITLKGNGSFYIREGWLTKGLVEIEKNPELFSKKYFEGADALGVGSVMAKSIKYWLMAAGLIVKKAEQSPVKYDIKKGSFISKCGKLILENDKYIENKDTLWIIHYNIASNYKDATMWNLFFNSVSEERFNRREFEFMMEEELEKRGMDRVHILRGHYLMTVRCFFRCILMTTGRETRKKKCIVRLQNFIC